MGCEIAASTFTSVFGSNEQFVHTFVFLEFDLGVEKKNCTSKNIINSSWLHSGTKGLIKKKKKYRFLAENIKSFFLTTDSRKISDVCSS